MTAGPAEGDTVRYNVPISWSGEDPDGSIIRYEYAIDPDSAFSEDEIANGGSGIVSKPIKGTNGAPDTTRVTNNSGDSFDWIHTQETSGRFQFSTPLADSVYAKPTGRFYGMHAFYVRAVDNDGAASVPDKAAFTAKTIAPTSTILRPQSGETALILGDSLHVLWTGRDPDGRSRQPKGIYYALVHPRPIPCDPIGCSPYSELYDATWTFISGETTSFVLPLEVPSAYVFAVRAVDESGAVEPFLDWNRNAIEFSTREGGLQPSLSILYKGLVFTFPDPSGGGSLELPAGREAVFELTCSAEAYGESCVGFRWGLDIPDLQHWAGGWSSATEIHLTPGPGTHILYIEARDTLGHVTLAALILHAIAFSFEREVLFVDDSFDNIYPNDAEHDAFWEGMVAYYLANSDLTADQIGEFAVFGAGDRDNLEPSVPRLSDLAKYKLVVWSNAGWGYNSDSGLYRATVLSPLLSNYLLAGGKLWLEGRMTVAATTGSYGGTGADLDYPKTELGPGDFAWDFLKLHSSKINNDRGLSDANLFHGARQFPGMPVVYDTMSVDIPKLSVYQGSKGGFSHADAVFDPNYAESEPDFRGSIDTLYAYGAAGPEVQGRLSQYQNRLCAIRWHDPDPNPAHGRTQWFGFPLYYMNSSQAELVFKKSLDWFREEEPPITR